MPRYFSIEKFSPPYCSLTQYPVVEFLWGTYTEARGLFQTIHQLHTTHYISYCCYCFDSPFSLWQCSFMFQVGTSSSPVCIYPTIIPFVFTWSGCWVRVQSDIVIIFLFALFCVQHLVDYVDILQICIGELKHWFECPFIQLAE